MRLWMLIGLCLVVFLPMPIMIWRDGLQQGEAAGQCSADFCTISTPEAFMPAMQEQPFAKTQHIEKQNAERR